MRLQQSALDIDMKQNSSVYAVSEVWKSIKTMGGMVWMAEIIRMEVL